MIYLEYSLFSFILFIKTQNIELELFVKNMYPKKLTSSRKKWSFQMMNEENGKSHKNNLNIRAAGEGVGSRELHGCRK